MAITAWKCLLSISRCEPSAQRRVNINKAVLCWLLQHLQSSQINPMETQRFPNYIGKFVFVHFKQEEKHVLFFYKKTFEFKNDRDKNFLPSFFMPALKHFFSLQYLH